MARKSLIDRLLLGEEDKNSTLVKVWVSIFWVFISAVLGGLVLGSVYETSISFWMGALMCTLPGACVAWFSVVAKNPVARVLRALAVLMYPVFWFGI